MLAAVIVCQQARTESTEPAEPASRSAATADTKMISRIMIVGFSQALGGEIVDLSTGERPNLVNVHDRGRLIQQPYHAGAALARLGHYSAWKTWLWNPIQGWDAHNFTPGASRFEMLADGRLFGESIDLNWPGRDERLRSTIRQWAQFESPGVLQVDFKLVRDREYQDEWGDEPVPGHEEVPASNFVTDLARLASFLEGRRGSRRTDGSDDDAHRVDHLTLDQIPRPPDLLELPDHRRHRNHPHSRTSTLR